MNYKNSDHDFALALSWPDKLCRNANSWYDGLMRLLGFNKRGYYRVGHAALVYISGKNGKVYYFDFGRYVCPDGMGRVRSEETDHNLKVNTRIKFDDKGNPFNITELIAELEANETCRGKGDIRYSLVAVEGTRLVKRIISMQSKCFIPYGPFVWGGTNCSRFVRTSLLGVIKHPLKRLALYLYMISPTPLGNVKVLGEAKNEFKQTDKFNAIAKVDTSALNNLPNLYGVGASSYFDIQNMDDKVCKVNRFDEKGNIESSGLYRISPIGFTSNNKFQLLYPSNSCTVNLIQEGIEYSLIFLRSTHQDDLMRNWFYSVEKIIA